MEPVLSLPTPQNHPHTFPTTTGELCLNCGCFQNGTHFQDEAMQPRDAERCLLFFPNMISRALGLMLGKKTTLGIPAGLMSWHCPGSRPNFGVARTHCMYVHACVCPIRPLHAKERNWSLILPERKIGTIAKEVSIGRTFNLLPQLNYLPAVVARFGRIFLKWLTPVNRTHRAEIP